VEREWIWNAHGMMDCAMNAPKVRTASGASFEAQSTTNTVNEAAVRAAAEGTATGIVKGMKP